MNDITRQNCIEFLNALEDKISEVDAGEIGAVNQISFGCKLFAIAFDINDELVGKLAWKYVKSYLVSYIKHGWFSPSCGYDDILGRIPSNDSSHYFVRFMFSVMYESMIFRDSYIKDINNGNFGDSYAF